MPSEAVTMLASLIERSTLSPEEQADFLAVAEAADPAKVAEYAVLLRGAPENVEAAVRSVLSRQSAGGDLEKLAEIEDQEIYATLQADKE